MRAKIDLCDVAGAEVGAIQSGFDSLPGFMLHAFHISQYNTLSFRFFLSQLERFSGLFETRTGCHPDSAANPRWNKPSLTSEGEHRCIGCSIEGSVPWPRGEGQLLSVDGIEIHSAVSPRYLLCSNGRAMRCITNTFSQDFRVFERNQITRSLAAVLL